MPFFILFYVSLSPYDLDNCCLLILNFLGGTGSVFSLFSSSTSTFLGLLRGLRPLDLSSPDTFSSLSSALVWRRGLDLDPWPPLTTLSSDLLLFSLEGDDSDDFLSDLCFSLPLRSFSLWSDLLLSLSYLCLSLSDLSFSALSLSDLDELGDLWWWWWWWCEW